MAPMQSEAPNGVCDFGAQTDPDVQSSCAVATVDVQARAFVPHETRGIVVVAWAGQPASTTVAWGLVIATTAPHFAVSSTVVQADGVRGTDAHGWGAQTAA
jgi:hypothetical protein